MSVSELERARPSAEELANSVSHGLGLVALVVALPFLLRASYEQGGTLALIGAGVFGGSAVLVYLASTVLHALPDGVAKQRFEVLDHSAIYLLIAGTYTPFTLGVLRGGWGWALLAAVWTLAVVGVCTEILSGARRRLLALGLYLGMGWLVVLAARTVFEQMAVPGIALVFAGGVAYTAGVVFYLADRMRFGHLIWHFFVMLGTACHFLAVLWYAC